jgi:hypothetical protein
MYQHKVSIANLFLFSVKIRNPVSKDFNQNTKNVKLNLIGLVIWIQISNFQKNEKDEWNDERTPHSKEV